ncbi:hypothetical protein C0J52_05139 [Blattella germanica]|nr:hypothetical protein C0J52_05139 [Blattella germanica]
MKSTFSSFLTGTSNENGPIDPLRADEELRSYILQLARGKDQRLSERINNFIKDTCKKKEKEPKDLLKKIRQFITDVKNYLYKEKQQRLDQFQNLDVDVDIILENVFHNLITRQLSDQAYNLLLKNHKSTVDLSKLYGNVKRIQAMNMTQMGLDKKKIVTSFSMRTLKKILKCLRRMQYSWHPLKKLEHLTKCFENIHKLTKIEGADDLIPVFVWILAQTETLNGVVEAEYMRLLLPPSLTHGIEDFLITTLYGASEALINFNVEFHTSRI